MRRPTALNLRAEVRPAKLFLLVVFAASGCSDGPPAPPDVSPVLARLEVSPTVVGLFAVAPGNTVPLTVVARTEMGAPIPGAGAATYSSSAPTVARVSSSGVVTAAAPGTAVITASLTLDGITQTTSTFVVVHPRDEAPGQYREITGVYDLAALITQSDPIWGVPDGTRQTAVVTIQRSGDTPQLTGTFANFRAIEPSGDSSYTGNGGVVSGSIDPNERVIIEFTFDGSQSSNWYGEGILTSEQIVGRFGCCGHISGTFTAQRRPAE